MFRNSECYTENGNFGCVIYGVTNRLSVIADTCMKPVNFFFLSPKINFVLKLNYLILAKSNAEQWELVIRRCAFLGEDFVGKGILHCFAFVSSDNIFV